MRAELGDLLPVTHEVNRERKTSTFIKFVHWASPEKVKNKGLL